MISHQLSDSPLSISSAEARQIILGQQGLLEPGDSPLAIINHLGYVQIDSINVVERAHHHILWSRCPDFTPDQLESLHGVRKAVFEYWAHAMSFLPMKDYRYSLPNMERFAQRQDCQEILASNRPLVKEIRSRINSEGPLSASDFSAPAEFKSTGWWDRKPAKQILEVLFWQGELMISHRKNFKRFYDLTGRVLAAADEKPDTSMPSAEETFRHYLRRVMRTLGVAARSDLLWFVKDKAGVLRVLNEMISAGEVSTLRIEGLEDSYHALPAVLEKAGRVPKKVRGSARNGAENLLHILSPFDNLMIRRDFVKRLFAFDYLFECYVPEARRKFGYFSCPILAGNDLVGTIDAKADRAQRELIVKSLHLQAGAEALLRKSDLARNLAAGIRDFADFNGCAAVKIACTGKPARAIEAQLKQL